MNSHVFDGTFEEIYTVCEALPEISPWASMVWVLRFPIVTGSKQLSYHYITLRKQRAKRNFETTRTRKTLSTTNISTTTTHVSGLKIHLNCSPLEPQCRIHELKHLSSLYMLTKKQPHCHLSLQDALASNPGGTIGSSSSPAGSLAAAGSPPFNLASL